jgi:hypothetical protein
MPWFRIDDTFAFHPKVLAAGNEAIGAWVRLGSYCAAHLTDGLVPELSARMVASADCLQALVEAKLLLRERDGYRIHDYLSYQPSKRTVLLDREQAKIRKRRNTYTPGSRERPVGMGEEGNGSASVSSGESQERGPLPGNPNESARAIVDRWRDMSQTVLDALNASRKRVRPSSRGISASYDSLGHIAARLEAGKSTADCLHVVEVCEAECRRDADSFKWFDAVTPFRPENFERKSAADPTLIAAMVEAKRIIGHARAGARYDKTSDGTGDL